jgi:cyclophilin family peptidyl-prolyl cis-trans isomerase/HEAT repeat protein
MQDADALVRARLVEAASKFEHPALQTAVLRALPDPDEAVRVEAALGVARWKRDAPDAASIDSALIAALRPLELPQAGEAPVGSAFTDAVIYALARRQSEKGRGAFLEHLGSPSSAARIHSAKGLASLKPDAQIAASLRDALRDTDWRVAYEAAVGLAQSGDEASVDELLRAVEHASAHVRAAALSALGSFPQARARSQAALERGLLDISASVRASALRSLTLVLEPAIALVRVRAAAADADAVVRRGAAQAAAALPGEAGLGVLEELARDRNLMVAGAALEGLGALPSERARDVLAQYVVHADDGLKLGAVQALRPATTSSDVPRYRQALSQARSEIRSELACNVALSLGGIGGDDARQLLEELLQDRDLYVRRRAQELLREKFAREADYDKRPPLSASNSVPQPGKDAPLWTHAPLIVIVTTRGEMVFELFPEEAPLHVHNLLELAARNAYDGLSFHRVVPDFVVQGGDKRGDGNGGVSWRGDSLRAEFSSRKFERGSLGMPRNDDPDSGGSQLFVTHRATPHLDGRYTVFGQLRAGFEVLDLIEVGDRILDVRPVR